MFILKIFSRRWALTTLLVLAAVSFLARLGVWQLDRLQQRKESNVRVLEQINQPGLILDGTTVIQDLIGMEYRQVVVEGKYDFSSQVALRNQVWENMYGAHLLTPLRIRETNEYILVDRGWIPNEEFEAGLATGNWIKFDESGDVTVQGIIRRSQNKPDFGRISDPTPVAGARLLAWNLVNLDQMESQMPYQLLPVYVQQAPEGGWTALPNRSQPEIEITEGPHLGYAIQWFTFALILLLGYPFFIYREEKGIINHPSNHPMDMG